MIKHSKPILAVKSRFHLITFYQNSIKKKSVSNNSFLIFKGKYTLWWICNTLILCQRRYFFGNFFSLFLKNSNPIKHKNILSKKNMYNVNSLEDCSLWKSLNYNHGQNISEKVTKSSKAQLFVEGFRFFNSII